MKVRCIDDMGNDGIKLQITAGKVYTAHECPRFGFYTLDEHRTYEGCIVCYEKDRFVPLSEIDETEMINKKELVNA
jgi:hypothetical protein